MSSPNSPMGISSLLYLVSPVKSHMLNTQSEFVRTRHLAHGPPERAFRP